MLFKIPATHWTPTVTPPKPPRAQLCDPIAPPDTLFAATSRLGHDLIGVFAKCHLPFILNGPPRRLCEYRSERGTIRVLLEEHAAYIAQAPSTKNIIVRGHILVDGTGNSRSYCTHIQENLRAHHYNCAYTLQEDKIWITQTAPIAANEELSIQYSKDGAFWRDRDDYPLELYTLASDKYSLPPRKASALPGPEMSLTPANPTTADFADELMLPQYYYHYPVIVPPCSLRLGTLNVNGALHNPERDSPALLSHLMQSASISVIGITDARFSPTEVEQVNTAFRRFLPRGTAIIAFPTERPYSTSHRNTTMG